MASQNDIYQTQLPKIRGKNCHIWGIQMRIVFESQDLWTSSRMDLKNQNKLMIQVYSKFVKIKK